MANRYRGEVDLEIGGQTYTLRYGMNEVAEIFTKTGVNVLSHGGIQQLLEDPVKLLTSIQIGFRRHHEEMTREQAGDLVDEIGVLKFAEAMNKSFVALPGPEGAALLQQLAGPGSAPAAAGEGEGGETPAADPNGPAATGTSPSS